MPGSSAAAAQQGLMALARRRCDVLQAMIRERRPCVPPQMVRAA